MRNSLAIAILVFTSFTAFAAPDPRYCRMAGTLAKGIAQDRERGVSYKAELGKIRGAAGDDPNTADILAISQSALKLVYLDMPKLSPDGAYNMYFVMCMSGER